jgi:DNA-binding HxlR family transcriptional regulator
LPATAPQAKRPSSGLLGILADDWTWLCIRALAEQPQRQEQIESQLPPLGASTVNERLHRLLAIGIAVERRISAQPPLIAFQLTHQGRQARAIRPAAGAWEARLAPAAAAQSHLPGGTALALLADRWILPIMAALAAGCSGRAQIAGRISGLSPSTLDDRLHRLSALGLVRSERRLAFPVRISYQLTPTGCSLPSLALRCYCWEWRWTRPARPQLASDLRALLRFTAPLVRLDSHSSGVCELSVCDSGAPSTLVAITEGRIRVLAHREHRRADARAQARSLAWCRALLTGAPRALQIDGSVALVQELIGALHGALAAGSP